MLVSTFNFHVQIGGSKLACCCFSGDFYVDVGKLVELSRGVVDFLVDLASSGYGKASPDMDMGTL